MIGFDCHLNKSEKLNLCTKQSGDHLIYQIFDVETDKLLKKDSLYKSEGYWIGNDLVEFKKYNGIGSKSTGLSTQILRYRVSTNSFVKTSDLKK